MVNLFWTEGCRISRISRSLKLLENISPRGEEVVGRTGKRMEKGKRKKERKKGRKKERKKKGEKLRRLIGV
jgi:hypothetical protein